MEASSASEILITLAHPSCNPPPIYIWRPAYPVDHSLPCRRHHITKVASASSAPRCTRIIRIPLRRHRSARGIRIGIVGTSARVDIPSSLLLMLLWELNCLVHHAGIGGLLLPVVVVRLCAVAFGL